MTITISFSSKNDSPLTAPESRQAGREPAAKALRDALQEGNPLGADVVLQRVSDKLATAVNINPDKHAELQESLAKFILIHRRNGGAELDAEFLGKLIDIVQGSGKLYSVDSLGEFESRRKENSGSALTSADLVTIEQYLHGDFDLISLLGVVQKSLSFTKEHLENPEAYSVDRKIFQVERHRKPLEGDQLTEACLALNRNFELLKNPASSDVIAQLIYQMAQTGNESLSLAPFVSRIETARTSDPMLGYGMLSSVQTLAEARSRVGKRVEDADLEAFVPVFGLSRDTSNLLHLLTEVIYQAGAKGVEPPTSQEIIQIVEQLTRMGEEDYLYTNQVGNICDFARARVVQTEGAVVLTSKDLDWINSIPRGPEELQILKATFSFLPALQKQMNEDSQGYLSAERIQNILDLATCGADYYSQGSSTYVSDIYKSFKKYTQGRTSFPSDDEFATLKRAAERLYCADDLLQVLGTMRKKGLIDNQGIPSEKTVQAVAGLLDLRAPGFDAKSCLRDLLNHRANKQLTEEQLQAQMERCAKLLSEVDRKVVASLVKRIPDISKVLGEDADIVGIVSGLEGLWDYAKSSGDEVSKVVIS